MSAMPMPVMIALHVGEVDVDLARHGDQIADALHRLAQHVVGDAEGVGERRAALDERRAVARWGW